MKYRITTDWMNPNFVVVQEKRWLWWSTIAYFADNEYGNPKAQELLETLQKGKP